MGSDSTLYNDSKTVVIYSLFLNTVTVDIIAVTNSLKSFTNTGHISASLEYLLLNNYHLYLSNIMDFNISALLKLQISTWLFKPGDAIYPQNYRPINQESNSTNEEWKCNRGGWTTNRIT